jgi:aminoglycoside 6-adenylyltransferase
MKNEAEVLNQILEYAHNNNKIRAVILNGSRVNPNVTKDIFCDYDVIFAVTDPEYFLHNQEWIKHFGELVIMQQNKLREDKEEWVIFLMLFIDGVRIDLSFRNIETINNYLNDSLTKVLLDKDNRIPELEQPNDKSYFTNQPTKEEFAKVMNEILWCSTNVAKGLWREEMPYAKYMFDVIVRNCMITMLGWYVGMNNNWHMNTGMAGRWLIKFLPAEIWESFNSTYAGSDHNDMWDSLMEAGRLTRSIGIEIADKLGFEYPLEDDQRVKEYLERVRFLPKNADHY